MAPDWGTLNRQMGFCSWLLSVYTQTCNTVTNCGGQSVAVKSGSTTSLASIFRVPPFYAVLLCRLAKKHVWFTVDSFQKVLVTWACCSNIRGNIFSPPSKPNELAALTTHAQQCRLIWSIAGGNESVHGLRGNEEQWRGKVQRQRTVGSESSRRRGGGGRVSSL